MMLTQNGKLLYISDNAAEYLGHSMVRALVFSPTFALKASLQFGFWVLVMGLLLFGVPEIVTTVDTNL